jgi:uncharacterized protein YjiS (DUF1127 family)
MREYSDQPSFGPLAREVSSEPARLWLRAAASRVAGLWERAADRFGRWREDRETIRALGRLDDHMLRDIGLDRADLPPTTSRGDLRGVVGIVEAFFPRPPPKRQ